MQNVTSTKRWFKNPEYTVLRGDRKSMAVFCLADSAPDDTWVETDDAPEWSMYPIYTLAGNDYYGWLDRR